MSFGPRSQRLAPARREQQQRGRIRPAGDGEHRAPGLTENSKIERIADVGFGSRQRRARRQQRTRFCSRSTPCFTLAGRARIFAADLAERGAGHFLLAQRGERLAEPQQRVRRLRAWLECLVDTIEEGSAASRDSAGAGTGSRRASNCASGSAAVARIRSSGRSRRRLRPARSPCAAHSRRRGRIRPWRESEGAAIAATAPVALGLRAGGAGSRPSPPGGPGAGRSTAPMRSGLATASTDRAGARRRGRPALQSAAQARRSAAAGRPSCRAAAARPARSGSASDRTRRSGGPGMLAGGNDAGGTGATCAVGRVGCGGTAGPEARRRHARDRAAGCGFAARAAGCGIAIARPCRSAGGVCCSRRSIRSTSSADEPCATSCAAVGGLLPNTRSSTERSCACAALATQKRRGQCRCRKPTENEAVHGEDSCLRRLSSIPGRSRPKCDFRSRPRKRKPAPCGAGMQDQDRKIGVTRWRRAP